MNRALAKGRWEDRAVAGLHRPCLELFTGYSEEGQSGHCHPPPPWWGQKAKASQAPPPISPKQSWALGSQSGDPTLSSCSSPPPPGSSPFKRSFLFHFISFHFIYLFFNCILGFGVHVQNTQDSCIGTHRAVCFAAFLPITYIWHFSPCYLSPTPHPVLSLPDAILLSNTFYDKVHYILWIIPK